MKNRKSILLILLAAILGQIAGCASSGAPEFGLPDPNDRNSLAYGGWIIVNSTDEKAGSELSGELVAIDSTNLYLLTEFSEFLSVPLKDIQKATLTAYDIKSGKLGLWVGLGLLSTASHGMVVIASAPAWLLFGALPVIGQSYAPRHSYPKESWESIRRFARFPQGLPSGLKSTMLSRTRQITY